MRKLSGNHAVALLAVALMAVDFSFLESAGVGRMDIMCAALGAAAIAAYLWLRERKLETAILVSQSAIVLAALAHPIALGACVGLAAMAVTTTQAKFGMLVYCNSYRNPELLADMSRTIDLLISDLKMPGMDGNELARELNVSRPGLPILIVTGEQTHNYPPELTSYVVDMMLDYASHGLKWAA